MSFATADLCDAHPHEARVAEPLFRHHGGKGAFCGRIATLKLFEDNGLVRSALETPGDGRVLVVDGGGSMRCALLGDNLAALAVSNDWAGVVVFGCIRDASQIAAMPLGVLALGVHPRKSIKKNLGDVDIPVAFAGVAFHPGEWLYADADGLVVSAAAIHTAP